MDEVQPVVDLKSGQALAFALVFFFFFQAEDGIRDLTVTGVQMCALPILPPPVLVGTARAAAALVDDLGAFGQDLIDEFWPGALTLVFRASPTLLWDLGDTKGTVALRMPLHSVALDVLKQTGPLAVSSANRHGQPSAINADEAEQQLGEAGSIYPDA